MSIHQRFRDGNAARDAAAAVLRHWHDEWKKLLSEARKSRYLRPPARAIVAFEAGHIRVRSISGNEISELSEIPRNGTAVDTALLASLCVGQNIKDVSLELPQESLLHMAIRLPQASKATLRKALRFELMRLSPIEPGQLYFDFEIKGQDKITNKVDIDLRIIKREIVDDAIRYCHATGLAIGSIAFAGDGHDADWQHFPIDRSAFLRLLWARWSLVVLAALAIVLLCIVILSAYARNEAILDSLDNKLIRDARGAAAIGHLRGDIAATEAQAGFLSQQKQAPLFVAVLAEITHVVPDGAWLTNVQMNGSKLRIQGYAHSAADLIGRIDKSKLFANAQFEAPVVQDTAQKAERFDISLLIVRQAR